MMMRIEDIIVKTILSIEGKMYRAWEKHVPYRTNCFQFLGFDVLIDSDLKPWLLEVNMNSSLATETKMDFDIKSEMTANMLSLIGVEPIGAKCNLEDRMNEKVCKFKDRGFKGGRKKKKGANTKYRKKDMLIVQETREEVLRAKRWKLIYPSYNASIYKNYFEEQRPYNTILMTE